MPDCAKIYRRDEEGTTRSFSVTTPDGVNIFGGEWGNPQGPEIVLIHGFSQSYLAWQRQFADPDLLARFRIIAYDLRGHGKSTKPDDPAAYTTDRLWADELASVIAALNLRRPVLVPWSYGGRVVSDYVRHYGIAGISGINFVCALAKSTDEFGGPALHFLGSMISGDATAADAATKSFLAACFAAPLPQREFENMLAYNLLVTPTIRKALLNRVGNPGDLLPSLTLPVLLTHGTEDQMILPGMSQFAAERIPGAAISIYDGIGHSPFYEDAPRFNRELTQFVNMAVARIAAA